MDDSSKTSLPLKELPLPSLPPLLPLEYFRGVKRGNGRPKVPVDFENVPIIIARGLTPQLALGSPRFRILLSAAGSIR